VTSTADLIQLVLPTAYPVGSIYTSVVSTNPATLFGFGTWVAFGQGRVLVGLNSGDTDFDTPEETGGEKTHTLTVAEMPAHQHTGGITTGGALGIKSAPDVGTTLQDTGSVGGGGAHNNVQPYIVVYMWKRSA
jgi:microcystin-dependent protein